MSRKDQKKFFEDFQRFQQQQQQQKEVEQDEDEEDREPRRVKIDLEHCFCGRPHQSIKTKDGDVYLKCGLSLDAIKQEGWRPCTLFCKKDEWACIVTRLQQRFPEGLDFHLEWPECGHRLKARVGATKDRTGCFFPTCRATFRSL
jgi:hypothetical protein